MFDCYACERAASMKNVFNSRMVIMTRLTEKDITGMNMALFYRKWSTKVFIVVAILMLSAQLIELAFHIGIAKFDITALIMPIAILAGLPVLTYFAARKSYRNSLRLQEPMEYHFHADYLDIKGSSFTSQMSWDKVYKVMHVKDWLLIYQSPQIANVIPMRDVWESQLDELKEIVQQKGVKNNL